MFGGFFCCIPFFLFWFHTGTDIGLWLNTVLFRFWFQIIRKEKIPEITSYTNSFYLYLLDRQQAQAFFGISMLACIWGLYSKFMSVCWLFLKKCGWHIVNYTVEFFRIETNIYKYITVLSPLFFHFSIFCFWKE